MRRRFVQLQMPQDQGRRDSYALLMGMEVVPAEGALKAVGVAMDGLLCSVVVSVSSDRQPILCRASMRLFVVEERACCRKRS